jgi:urease accessory protein
MKFRVIRVAALATVLIALSGPALAHTGHSGTSGFVHGFMHPMGGLDHVLVMVAVGFYAARLGGRALWRVPATFIAVMAFGGAAGAAGYGPPYTEIVIALSVVVLGLAVALRLSLSTTAAMVLVGAFAIFHGQAHGTEMPPHASGVPYAAGFMSATMLLHSSGIAIGSLAGRLAERSGVRAVRATGGAVALAGIAILAGIL